MSPSPITAVIFDADGVLLDSPHERAWREALVGLADPERFTPALYQAEVAGRPRLDGAVAALTALGVADAAGRAGAYAARKQRLIEDFIAAGAFAAFADAVRLVERLKARGLKLAVASSSHNASEMLRRLGLSARFDADLSGRPVAHGKPHPDIFLAAAAALGVAPAGAVVIEDAPAGIAAARAGGMAAVGIARVHDVRLLEGAGANLVVTSLDHIDADALAHGRLAASPS
jgi:HAD superfamily hydrolase (TIGR01509 family)